MKDTEKLWMARLLVEDVIIPEHEQHQQDVAVEIESLREKAFDKRIRDSLSARA